MRNPFNNFFKKVFQHKATRPVPVSKPVEQVREEKKTQVRIPEKITKTYHRPPVMHNRLESIRRHRRNIRNRIQKISRINNR